MGQEALPIQINLPLSQQLENLNAQGKGADRQSIEPLILDWIRQNVTTNKPPETILQEFNATIMYLSDKYHTKEDDLIKMLGVSEEYIRQILGLPERNSLSSPPIESSQERAQEALYNNVIRFWSAHPEGASAEEIDSAAETLSNILSISKDQLIDYINNNKPVVLHNTAVINDVKPVTLANTGDLLPPQQQMEPPKETDEEEVPANFFARRRQAKKRKQSSKQKESVKNTPQEEEDIESPNIFAKRRERNKTLTPEQLKAQAEMHLEGLAVGKKAVTYIAGFYAEALLGFGTFQLLKFFQDIPSNFAQYQHLNDLIHNTHTQKVIEELVTQRTDLLWMVGLTGGAALGAVLAGIVIEGTRKKLLVELDILKKAKSFFNERKETLAIIGGVVGYEFVTSTVNPLIEQHHGPGWASAFSLGLSLAAIGYGALGERRLKRRLHEAEYGKDKATMKEHISNIYTNWRKVQNPNYEPKPSKNASDKGHDNHAKKDSHNNPHDKPHH